MVKKISNIVLHYDEYLEYYSDNLGKLSTTKVEYDNHITENGLGSFFDTYDLEEVIKSIISDLIENPIIWLYFDYSDSEKSILSNTFSDISNEDYQKIISVLFEENSDELNRNEYDNSIEDNFEIVEIVEGCIILKNTIINQTLLYNHNSFNEETRYFGAYINTPDNNRNADFDDFEIYGNFNDKTIDNEGVVITPELTLLSNGLLFIMNNVSFEDLKLAFDYDDTEDDEYDSYDTSFDQYINDFEPIEISEDNYDNLVESLFSINQGIELSDIDKILNIIESNEGVDLSDKEFDGDPDEEVDPYDTSYEEYMRWPELVKISEEKYDSLTDAIFNINQGVNISTIVNILETIDSI